MVSFRDLGTKRRDQPLCVGFGLVDRALCSDTVRRTFSRVGMGWRLRTARFNLFNRESGWDW